MLEIAAHGGREGFAGGLGRPLGIFTEESWIWKEERENATFIRERQRARLCKARRPEDQRRAQGGGFGGWNAGRVQCGEKCGKLGHK